MAGKMIITVGIPASGKSTWAEEEFGKDPDNVVLVERDKTRSLMFGEKYHTKSPDRKSEDKVTQVNDELIKQGLRDGKTVIVSDNNTNTRFLNNLTAMGIKYGADVQFEHFDVDPEECKRRNKARGASGGREVPEHVMDNMISRSYGEDGHLKEMKMSSKTGQVSFIPQTTPGSRLIDNFNKKAEFDHPITDYGVVVFDVDGTLCDNRREAKKAFGGPHKKDYGYFFKSIGESAPNPEVVALAKEMRNEGLNIVVLTGRSDQYAKELLSFLKKTGVPISKLYCKKDGDFRPDYDFKKEVIEEMRREGHPVVHAVDDRPQSIQVWERAGILVSRVEHFGPEAVLPEGDLPPVRLDTVYGSGHCIKCGSALKDASKSIGPKCALGGKD